MFFENIVNEWASVQIDATAVGRVLRRQRVRVRVTVTVTVTVAVVTIIDKFVSSHSSESKIRRLKARRKKNKVFLSRTINLLISVRAYTGGLVVLGTIIISTIVEGAVPLSHRSAPPLVHKVPVEAREGTVLCTFALYKEGTLFDAKFLQVSGMRIHRATHYFVEFFVDARVVAALFAVLSLSLFSLSFFSHSTLGHALLALIFISLLSRSTRPARRALLTCNDSPFPLELSTKV